MTKERWSVHKRGTQATHLFDVPPEAIECKVLRMIQKVGVKCDSSDIHDSFRGRVQLRLLTCRAAGEARRVDRSLAALHLGWLGTVAVGVAAHPIAHELPVVEVKVLWVDGRPIEPIRSCHEPIEPIRSSHEHA